MKKIPAMLCATAILATPVWAQTAPATPEAATSEGATPDTASPAATPSEGGAADTAPAESGTAEGGGPAASGIAEPGMAASQDRVISMFEAAGYTDVRIVDTTYAVKARTPEGETVTVVIDLATMPRAADAPDGADGSDPVVDATRFGGPAASEPEPEEAAPAAAE